MRCKRTRNKLIKYHKLTKEPCLFVSSKCIINCVCITRHHLEPRYFYFSNVISIISKVQFLETEINQELFGPWSVHLSPVWCKQTWRWWMSGAGHGRRRGGALSRQRWRRGTLPQISGSAVVAMLWVLLDLLQVCGSVLVLHYRNSSPEEDERRAAVGATQEGSPPDPRTT